MTKAHSNNRVERTAAMRLYFDGDGLQIAVIAVASALPAAVAHPCRSASTDHGFVDHGSSYQVRVQSRC